MSEVNEKKSMFFEHTVFKGIPKDELLNIFQTVQHRIVPANTIIFRQGDPGDSFYIIYSGRAKIYRKRRTGETTELAILGPGDSVGEIALLTGEERSAYLETMEETHLLVLSKAQFDRALVKSPNIAKAFVKHLSEKLIVERRAKRWFKLPRASWLDYLFIIAVSLLLGLTFNRVNPNGIGIIPEVWSGEKMSMVDPLMVFEKYQEGRAIFIDARPGIFFERAHIVGALNIPLTAFDIMYMMELSEIDKKQEVVVYGRTFSRCYDEQLAGKLVLRGYLNVVVLKGGLAEWKRKGFPVETQYRNR